MSLAPAALTGALTVTAMVDVPPAAIVPPANAQVISDPAAVHVQFVPTADTNVRFAGS